MDFGALLQGLPGVQVRGQSALRIDGIASDSRNVKQGFLFVAMPGATPQSPHGATFAQQALHSGAVAILTDQDLPSTIPVPVARVPDARKILSNVGAFL